MRLSVDSRNLKVNYMEKINGIIKIASENAQLYDTIELSII